MLTYIAITGTFNYRTTPTKTPAAGEVIEFVPRTAARPDGSEVLLPKTLSTTLNVSGQIPAGFSLPTLPGGVYYTVRETFEGGRGKYTILVNPGDPTTDLSDVAPVVPPPLLVSTRGPVGPPGPQPPLSNQVPAALGTAAPGIGTKAAREDHIHAMPTAAQVGADPAGTATGAVIAHEAAADPHPQYTTAAEAAAAAPVQTVAGRSGNVVLAVGDVANAVDTSDARLSDARTPTAHTHPLSDLTQSGATTNQVPQWDGSAWVPATVSGGGGGAWGSITGTLSAQTDLQSALDGKATSAQGAKADSALQPNAPITGATKTKITYDADGLVTGGADATTADIADSTNRRYVTDAQLVVIGNTSGTNTGDQTITLTGNVTGSGTGSFAATIANDAVTYAKMQNVSAASKLLGRGDSSSGDVEEITIGSGLTMTGTTLSASGGGGSGDFVGPASATDNAAVRFDTTTGKLGQNSALIIGDVSGSSLPVSTTPGNAIAISATAPTQTTGAQAGVTASLAASAAVAGSSTVGAAAGGEVTVEGGAAARLTSGNADGGSVRLKPGAGVGTGVAGQVLLDDDGTEARPALAFDIGGNKGYGLWYAAGVLGVSVNGVRKVGFLNGGVALYNGGGIAGDPSNPGFFFGLRRNRYDLSSSTTLTSGSYNGSTITNSTASAAITSTLASAAQGWNHTFIDDNATYRWTIKPNTADTIIWPDGTVVSATGSIVSTARYDAFDVEALDATVWLARNVRGTFTVTA